MTRARIAYLALPLCVAVIAAPIGAAPAPAQSEHAKATPAQPAALEKLDAYIEKARVEWVLSD